MTLARLSLVLLVGALFQPGVAAACDGNSHADGRGGCTCNTGYAMTKAGRCELKRAVFTPTPDKKDADKKDKVK